MIQLKSCWVKVLLYHLLVTFLTGCRVLEYPHNIPQFWLLPQRSSVPLTHAVLLVCSQTLHHGWPPLWSSSPHCTSCSPSSYCLPSLLQSVAALTWQQGFKNTQKKGLSWKFLNPQECEHSDSSHKQPTGPSQAAGVICQVEGILWNKPFPWESWVPILSWWLRITHRARDHHASRSGREEQTQKEIYQYSHQNGPLHEEED